MFLFIIVSLSLLLPACSLVPEEDRLLAPPLVKPAAVSASTVEAKIDTILKAVSGSAIFESTQITYHQFSENGGRLDEILVQAGDQVRVREPIIRMQTENLDIQLLKSQLEVEKKKLALDAAEATKDSRNIRIADLELQITSKELEEVEDQLQGKVLLSEANGVVTFIADLKKGDYIEPYFNVLTVADPGEMRLVLGSINVDLLKDVSEGMNVEIDYDEASYKGTVVQTPKSAPMVEDDRLQEKYSKSLFIKLDTLPKEAELGDMANVEIVVAQRSDVIVIPKSALRRNSGRIYVQVLEGESRREIDVQIGLETTSLVEITEGLEVGQLVITR